MRKIYKKTILLFSLIIAGTYLFSLADNTFINTNHEYFQPLSSAGGEGDGIYNENVTIDKDPAIVKRGIESISIIFENTSVLDSNYKHFIANITLPDGTEFNVTMVNETASSWTAVFIPNIYNQTGNANVSILALDDGYNIQNSNELGIDATFLIENNFPEVGVVLNSTEIFRGDTISLDLTPSDVEDRVIDLLWTVELYKEGVSVPVESILNQVNNVFSTEIDITTDFEIGDYYINATCWDTEETQNSSSKFYDISILDNFPVIDYYEFTVDDEVISDDVVEIFRGESLTIKLNASDLDYKSDSKILLSIDAQDPISGAELFFGNYKNLIPVQGNFYFEKNISFDIDFGSGIINLNIMIFENGSSDILDEFTQQILLKNNPPEISSILINGENAAEGDQISVLQGDWLYFTFDVSDEENQVEYVEVELLYTNMSSSEEEIFIYSTKYTGSDTVIQIRSVDLPVGSYIVWSYVVDSSGARTKITIPTSFDIYSYSKIDPTSWLLFAVGIIIGTVFTLAIAYSRILKANRTIEKRKITESDKKPKSTKESSKKGISDKKIEDKKQKPKEKSKKKRLIRKL